MNDEQVAELQKENERLQAEAAAANKLARRALASYQQRALQMEIIRQQNEDLDLLTADLAKAKRLAEEQTEKVSRSAELKSQFLANFSHEIRTPLNGIIGYVDLLSREEGERLTAHGRRDLRTVRRNAKTLLALINDILDLSKIEAGQAEVSEERVDLESLVSDCAATVRDIVRGREVEVVVDVAERAKGLVTDGLKLRQIVLNLMSNAAKFTEVGEVTLRAEAKGADLAISVEDTGVGIHPDDLPNIFEKFRQVDGSRTRTKGGTGLGLAIVNELVELLGGTIRVKSLLGRGSTFDLVLPGVIGTPLDTDSSNAPDAQLADKSFSVLVIDDDVMMQQLIKNELESERVAVFVAGDGIEGLKYARENKPDVILLDLRLPRLDGWTVLSELKSDERLRRIPVIILSIEEERAKGFSLGAYEYLVKPIEPEVLVGIVRSALGPGSGHVLVVDDDKDTRELVRRQLTEEGFRVQEASDGREAMLKIRADPPAMMVLDLVMPEVDGFEVMERLQRAGHRFPVVVLTGKTLTDAEQARLREGIVRVIAKDGVSVQVLLGEVRTRVEVTQDATRLPRVLYVEDVEQNRDIVRRYLHGIVDVLEAFDGEHGVEMAHRERPDLILMDLSLPRLDGWDATALITGTEGLGHIPVIALTAHSTPEDRRRAKDAGCIDYLTKPVDRDTLVMALRKHL